MTLAPPRPATVRASSTDEKLLPGGPDLVRSAAGPVTVTAVLVVHDGNAAVEQLLAAAGPSVRGLRIAARGASAKRNAGWRAAAAPIVAFTDDDCEVLPGWVAAAQRALAEPDVTLAAGPVHPRISRQRSCRSSNSRPAATSSARVSRKVSTSMGSSRRTHGP